MRAVLATAVRALVELQAGLPSDRPVALWVLRPLDNPALLAAADQLVVPGSRTPRLPTGVEAVYICSLRGDPRSAVQAISARRDLASAEAVVFMLPAEECLVVVDRTGSVEVSPTGNRGHARGSGASACVEAGGLLLRLVTNQLR